MSSLNKINPFVAGMIALAVVIGGAVYYVAYKPLMDAKSEALTRLEEAADFNDMLRIQLAAKKREAELVPQFESEIQAIQVAFPPYEDPISLRNELEALFISESVSVASIKETRPRVIAPATVDLQLPAAAVGVVDETHLLQFEGLLATDYEFEVLGEYSKFVKAIARLQMDTGRYFLVHPVKYEFSQSEGLTYVSASFKVTAFTLVDPASGFNPAVPPSALDGEGQSQPPYLGGSVLQPPVPAVPAE